MEKVIKIFIPIINKFICQNLDNCFHFFYNYSYLDYTFTFFFFKNIKKGSFTFLRIDGSLTYLDPYLGLYNQWLLQNFPDLIDYFGIRSYWFAFYFPHIFEKLGRRGYCFFFKFELIDYYFYLLVCWI